MLIGRWREGIHCLLAAVIVLTAARLSLLRDRQWSTTSQPASRSPAQHHHHLLTIQFYRRLVLPSFNWAVWMTKMLPDNDWNHLYPDFRERLTLVFAEVERVTGVPWALYEGLRSNERQLWLYAQGRSREGQIVTWQKVPYHHGAGLAADCYPKEMLWNSPHEMFEQFRDVYLRLGLGNPAWSKGDRGHVQLSDANIRQRALHWVRAGCPAQDPVVPNPDIRVLMDGQEVIGADAYLENGHTYVALRPVCDALDLSIAKVENRDGDWFADIVGERVQHTYPIQMKADVGFIWVHRLPVVVHWDATTKTIRVGGT